jgi:hypothetical protein
MFRAVSLAVLTAAAPGSEGPRSACPDEPTIFERALRRQSDADAALEAGQLELAAQLLDEVADAYPECPSFHKRRLMAVLRAFEARRAVFGTDGRREHLDVALARIEAYLESLRRALGDQAEGSAGYVRGEAARQEILQQLPSEPNDRPRDLGPISPIDMPDRPARTHGTTAPREPTRPWRPLAIAGGVAVGASLALLVVTIDSGVRAVRRENELESPGLGCTEMDPRWACMDLQHRGQAAQRTFVASLVMTPLLLGAGAALLAVAGRRQRSSRMTLAPTIDRRAIGLTLQGRF